MAKKTALILAGAVAKGAFEAGVLDILSQHVDEIPLFRIVAASSGSLNAAVYAIGIRTGTERRVAQRLVQLWLEDANWHNVLKANVLDIVRGEGFGTAERLLPLMKEAVAEAGFEPRKSVDLQLLLTLLGGDPGDIGGEPATTFEHVAKFSDEDFDTERGRDKIFRTALGSAAFPGLFAPVDVPGVGLSVDGGAVNNAPIKRAIEGGGVDRIIAVTPEPRVITPPAPLRGINLLSQLAEILINERLYRDLRDAESVNGHLREIDALAAEGVSSDAIEKVKRVLHWTPLDIVQIRPQKPLDGSAFSGFSSPAQMRAYVDVGREMAIAVLEALQSMSSTQ